MLRNRRHCSSLIHPSMRGCDAWCRGHLLRGQSMDFITASRRSPIPCSTMSTKTPLGSWSPTTHLKSRSKSSPRCRAFPVTRYPASTDSPTPAPSCSPARPSPGRTSRPPRQRCASSKTTSPRTSSGSVTAAPTTASCLPSSRTASSPTSRSGCRRATPRRRVHHYRPCIR
jgi:hypothetical protein